MKHLQCTASSWAQSFRWDIHQHRATPCRECYSLWQPLFTYYRYRPR